MTGLNILILGLIVGAVTFTTSTTSIMLWPRELLSKIHHKIEELVHCPWCTGFWLSILLVSTTTLELPTLYKWAFLDVICNSFASLAISGLVHYVLLRAYEPVSKYLVMRSLEKLKNKKNSN